jgi:hypothetical protein
LACRFPPLNQTSPIFIGSDLILVGIPRAAVLSWPLSDRRGETPRLSDRRNRFETVGEIQEVAMLIGGNAKALGTP